MSRAFSLLSLILALGCSVDHTGLRPGETRDSGPPFDGGPGFDAGPFDGSGLDVGPPFDGGPGFDGGPDTGCAFERRCSADMQNLVLCEDGEMQRTPCPVRCNSVTSVCEDLEPSNGLGMFLEMGASSYNATFDWPADYNDGDATWDTDDCDELPGSKGFHNPGGGVELCVLVFQDFGLDGMVRVVGSRGLAIVAQGNITIRENSALRADGRGATGGPGGGDGATPGTTADGPRAGGNGAHENGYEDAGGGGGGNGAEGGRGGNGDTAAGGARGGAASGALDPVSGGSGGGVGGTGGNAGEGGGGGGVLVLVARGTIVINGYIDVAGAGGFGGTSNDDSNWGAGGGGGSGGSLVLEAGGSIETGSAGVVLASGGGGGGGSMCGEDGVDGRPELPGAAPTGGGAAPNCANVGNPGSGGAGGVDGAGTEGVTGVGFNGNGGNGGGGGGGPGLVAVRAAVSPPTPFGRSGIYRVSEPTFRVVE